MPSTSDSSETKTNGKQPRDEFNVWYMLDENRPNKRRKKNTSSESISLDSSLDIRSESIDESEDESDGFGHIDDSSSSSSFTNEALPALKSAKQKASYMSQTNSILDTPSHNHQIHRTIDNEALQFWSDEELEIPEQDPLRTEYDEVVDNAHRVRMNESTTRVIASLSNLSDTMSQKRQLTIGQKKHKSLLLEKNYTHDDVINKLKHDDEEIIFMKAQPPSVDFLNRVLGPSIPQSKCFGCTVGLNVASVSHDALEELRRFIIAMYPRNQPWRVAIQVSKYYAKFIMKPSNEQARPGERKLKLWTPRSVYDHLTEHTFEPSFVLLNMMNDLKETMTIIKSTMLYRVPSEVAQSGRTPQMMDYWVNPDGLKQMIDVQKMMLTVMRSNPSKMLFGTDTNMSLSETIGTVIRPKANIARGKSVVAGKLLN